MKFRLNEVPMAHELPVLPDLRLLDDGPHCVCELASALGERQNNVSNHLARLRDAGLVRRSRHDADSRRIYYERDEEGVARALAALADVLR